MAALHNELPHLDNFLNAYMHQDWDLCGDTLEAVVAAYAQDTSAEDAGALRDEIALFLEAEGDRVEAAYSALYPNSVLPSGWGMTARQWLGRVAELAMAHSPAAPASPDACP